ncbi:MAG: hypothetical protein OXS32_12210, partial [Verrucomicrobiales bacterium]|nr:hypothetical protein [Verrucomicrobiales bacterium]
DLVSIINYRYDELVSIERNSKEEKQLLAFIDDFRKFLKTGKSELYGKERIVGRWKFAKNVSLRETRKNYVNVSTAQEMRAIHFRMERLDGLWARAWIGEKNEDGEKKENVIQFFGHSESAEYNQVLKLLDAQYQKALDDGEIEEEEDWDNGNYSQPVGYNETYGEDGNDEENKANRAKARMERTRKVIDWANTKDPDYIERLTSSVSTFARSRGESFRPQLESAKGSWDGSGSLYELNIDGIKEKFSAELRLLAGLRPSRLILTGNNVRATLKEDRLHIYMNRDVLVFTRF